MNDMMEFAIPFRKEFCDVTQRKVNGVWTDLYHVPTKRLPPDVQLQAVIEKIDFEAFEEKRLIDYGCNGGQQKITAVELDEFSLKTQFESLESSFSGVAFKVYNKGFGNTDAYVSIKCSPQKLRQGHNVYGNVDSISSAIEMLTILTIHKPYLSKMLDFEKAKLKQIHVTYSALVKPSQIPTVIAYLSNVHYGRTQATNVYGKETVYWGKGRTNLKKVYHKYLEVLHQIKEAKKKKKLHRVAKLEEVLNNSFTKKSLRFEAELNAEYLSIHLHPDFKYWNLLKQLDFIEKEQVFYNDESMPVEQYLFEKAFEPVFKAMQGHVMKDFTKEETLKECLLLAYKPTKADRLFAVFCRIKSEGYDVFKASYTTETEKRTFRRIVKDFTDAGLRRSDLQNISQMQKVVPLIEHIKIDFSQQLPSGYNSPDFDFDSVVSFLHHPEQLGAIELIRPLIEAFKKAA